MSVMLSSFIISPRIIQRALRSINTTPALQAPQGSSLASVPGSHSPCFIRFGLLLLAQTLLHLPSFFVRELLELYHHKVVAVFKIAERLCCILDRICPICYTQDRREGRRVFMLCRVHMITRR